MSNINFWMCTSDSRINLDVAYQKGGIWGAKSGKSYDKWWREISKGDLALFYLPKPVSGLVGIGEIVEKPSKTDLRPIWPDESHGRKKYPNRLCFEILHPKVNQPDWEQHKIPIHDV